MSEDNKNDSEVKETTSDKEKVWETQRIAKIDKHNSRFFDCQRCGESSGVEFIDDCEIGDVDCCMECGDDHELCKDEKGLYVRLYDKAEDENKSLKQHIKELEEQLVKCGLSNSNEAFILRFNTEPRIFVRNLDIARKALQLKKQGLIKRNVSVVKDAVDSFEYYFGWAEHGGKWWIQKIELLSDLDKIKDMLGE